MPQQEFDSHRDPARMRAIQSLTLEDLRVRLMTARGLFEGDARRNEADTCTLILSSLNRLEIAAARETMASDSAAAEKNRIAFRLDDFLRRSGLPDILSDHYGKLSPEPRTPPEVSAPPLPAVPGDARTEAIKSLTLEALSTRVNAARTFFEEKGRRDDANTCVLMLSRINTVARETTGLTITGEDALVEKNRIAFSLEEYLRANGLPDILSESYTA